jgi:hypothetical protein
MNVLGTFGSKLLAPNNRGIILDLIVFLVNLLLVRAVWLLANNLLHAAAEDARAKFVIGIFFTVLVFIQPLGPALRRWSFHQRHAFSTDSGAGCLLFWFMPVYLVLMFALCTVSAVVLGGVFSTSEGVAIALTLAGFVWCVISVCLVFSYFVPPKKTPRWAFLSTPAAEHLGDLSIYVNAVGLQMVWAGVTSSATFTELVTETPLGRPGSVSDILGRLVATSVCAALLYLPGRIYYLAEDKHRPLTYATMLLANLPLILRITLAPGAPHAG